jgi:hypothetical protein
VLAKGTREAALSHNSIAAAMLGDHVAPLKKNGRPSAGPVGLSILGDSVDADQETNTMLVDTARMFASRGGLANAL